VIKPGETDINMVFFCFPPAAEESRAARIVESFAQEGIRINSPENGVFRFVSHHWIGDGEMERIIKTAAKIFAQEQA
jgi:threonine aldolase